MADYLVDALPLLIPAAQAVELLAVAGVHVTPATVRNWARSRPELATFIGGRAYLRAAAVPELTGIIGRGVAA